MHRSACWLTGGFLLAAPIQARSEEPFEVIVVRGGNVSRVTGTESGEIHEELLREDPHPAEPEPAPEPARPARKSDDEEPRQAVVVYVVPGSPTVQPVYLGDRHLRSHRPHPYGYEPYPGRKPGGRGPGGWSVGRVRRP
jgi:hypothetical protein